MQWINPVTTFGEDAVAGTAADNYAAANVDYLRTELAQRLALLLAVTGATGMWLCVPFSPFPFRIFSLLSLLVVHTLLIRKILPQHPIHGRRLLVAGLMILLLAAMLLLEALGWLEYCNYGGNTDYTALRRRNGRETAWGVPVWGIGNEAWGAWETCFAPPDSYIRDFNQYAQYMRRLDPTIQGPECLCCCAHRPDPRRVECPPFSVRPSQP